MGIFTSWLITIAYVIGYYFILYIPGLVYIPYISGELYSPIYSKQPQFFALLTWNKKRNELITAPPEITGLMIRAYENPIVFPEKKAGYFFKLNFCVGGWYVAGGCCAGRDLPPETNIFGFQGLLPPKNLETNLPTPKDPGMS